MKTTPSIKRILVRAIGLGFVFIIGNATLPSSHAAPAPPRPVAPEALPLEKALERAVAQLHQLKLEFEKKEIAYDRAWDQMFMPTVSLSASTNSAKTLTHLKNTNADLTGETSYNHGYPASSIGISLASYTLFNSFRDQLNYENARIQWDQDRLDYAQNLRVKRNETKKTYFKLKMEQEKFEAAKRSLMISQAISDLVKATLAAKKATERDVSSANVDLLNAKNLVNDAEKSVMNEMSNLNKLLNDTVDKQYRLTTELQFLPIAINEEQILKLYYAQAPNFRALKASIRQAEIGVESAEKDRLPLPTVTFNGFNIAYAQGYYGPTHTPITTDKDGRIEVGASISLSIPIFGPDGFFKSRSLRERVIDRTIAETNFSQRILADQIDLKSGLSAIKQQQKNIINLKESYENSATLLDSLIAQMNTGAVSRLERRDAINQVVDTEFKLKDLYLAHLTAKLALAEFVGLDKLPGDLY
ncbi:TolC family protein [Bdellovibrionota bacterium FG-2]